MSKNNELRKIRDLLISQFKSMNYEELKVISDRQKHELPEGYDDFEMTINKTLNQNSSISIVVEFTDYSEPPVPPYILKIMDEYDVKHICTSMVNGFDIFPSGEIVDMHGEYDEEDD